MARINNYGDLKDAVLAWLNRDDDETVANLPLFIGFAEQEFSKAVKLPDNDGLLSQTIASVDPEYIQIPDDCMSPKFVTVNGKPYNRVDFETYTRMKSSGLKSIDTVITPDIATTTYSGYFTKFMNQWQFLPVLKEGDKVEMTYHKRLPEMVIDSDVSPALQDGGALMMYLSLRHASIFLRDFEQEQYWTAKAQEATTAMQEYIDETNWNGSAYVVPMFTE